MLSAPARQRRAADASTPAEEAFFFSLPFLSRNVGYNFSVTALGPDNRPVKLNGVAQASVREGGALRFLGSLVFNNTSNALFSQSFRDPGIYTMRVTDTYGGLGEERA